MRPECVGRRRAGRGSRCRRTPVALPPRRFRRTSAVLGLLSRSRCRYRGPGLRRRSGFDPEDAVAGGVVLDQIRVQGNADLFFDLAAHAFSGCLALFEHAAQQGCVQQSGVAAPGSSQSRCGASPVPRSSSRRRTSAGMWPMTWRSSATSSASGPIPRGGERRGGRVLRVWLHRHRRHRAIDVDDHTGVDSVAVSLLTGQESRSTAARR